MTDPLALRVARRYELKDIHFVVRPDGRPRVWRLYIHDSTVPIVEGSGELGWVQIHPAKDSELEDDCLASVDELREMVGDLEIYRVLQSELTAKAQGQGLGKVLYRRLFEHVAPAIIVADGCKKSGTTSAEAARVWNSLARDFPSAGSSPKNYALAVQRSRKMPSYKKIPF